MTVRVIITAHHQGRTIGEVQLHAYVDGTQRAQFDQQQQVSYVDIPDNARKLVVQATPIRSTLWPVVAEFDVSDPSDLVLVDVPEEFDFEADTQASAGGNRLHRIRVHLSRVRDVTDRANTAIASQQVDFSVPAREVYVLDAGDLLDPSSTPTRPRFHRETVDPDVEVRVLEVAGVPAPQLIAVAWPRAITPTVGAAPTPFLIYHRPTLDQNPDYYRQSPYPFGPEYIYSGLWGFLNYRFDPVADNPLAKGLPYQMAAEGQKIVIVLPLPRLSEQMPTNRHRREAGMGVFLNADDVVELLREIQGHFFRKESIFTPPPAFGRVALGAFSNGEAFTASFLKANKNHTFCRETLREVYLFDPVQEVATDAAVEWARPGGDRRVRIYRTRPSRRHRDLLGTAAPATPFEEHSDDDMRTLIALPEEPTWMAAINDARTELTADGVPRPSQPTMPTGTPKEKKRYVHQIIASTLLTHALRNSGF